MSDDLAHKDAESLLEVRSLGIKIAKERAQFPLTNVWKSQES